MSYRSEMLPWGPIELDGRPIVSSITANEKRRLQDLARDRTVLEIGSAYGYSTIILAQAATHVIAVDPHAGEYAGTWEAIHENLAAFGVTDKVELVRDYSDKALPAMIADGRQFGLIFIDGCHESPTVDSDILHALQLLEPTGKIAVHDYDWGLPDVKRACERLGEPSEIIDSLWVT